MNCWNTTQLSKILKNSRNLLSKSLRIIKFLYQPRRQNDQKFGKLGLMNTFFLPIPGVEPGPPGWKPGILTARSYGRTGAYYKYARLIRYTTVLVISSIKNWFVNFTVESCSADVIHLQLNNENMHSSPFYLRQYGSRYWIIQRSTSICLNTTDWKNIRN